MSDDNDDSRHQRFIIDIGDRQTLLIAHNTDLAERVPVGMGDRVRVRPATMTKMLQRMEEAGFVETIEKAAAIQRRVLSAGGPQRGIEPSMLLRAHKDASVRDVKKATKAAAMGGINKVVFGTFQTDKSF